MRSLTCLLLLLAAACEFEVDNTTTVTEDGVPTGPRFETPPDGKFTVRPLPTEDGPDGQPGRETIEKILEAMTGGRWEFLALQYVSSEPRRLRVELGDRVAVDAPATWEEGGPWLLGLSDEVAAGTPVTVVAAHRGHEKGRRVVLWIIGGAGRGRATGGEAVPVKAPADGVRTETEVASPHAPTNLGMFFKMVTPDIPDGFLTSPDFSPFGLATWVRVPTQGGSSTSYRTSNRVKSVSVTAGDVAIQGDGIRYSIHVGGKPVEVVDYPHVAWVFRGEFEAPGESED